MVFEMSSSFNDRLVAFLLIVLRMNDFMVITGIVFDYTNEIYVLSKILFPETMLDNTQLAAFIASVRELHGFVPLMNEGNVIGISEQWLNKFNTMADIFTTLDNGLSMSGKNIVSLVCGYFQQFELYEDFKLQLLPFCGFLSMSKFNVPNLLKSILKEISHFAPSNLSKDFGKYFTDTQMSTCLTNKKKKWHDFLRQYFRAFKTDNIDKLSEEKLQEMYVKSMWSNDPQTSMMFEKCYDLCYGDIDCDEVPFYCSHQEEKKVSFGGVEFYAP